MVAPEDAHHIMRTLATGEPELVMCRECLYGEARMTTFYIITDDGVIPSLSIVMCWNCKSGVPPCGCCQQTITDDEHTHPRWRSRRAAFGVCWSCRNDRCADDHDPIIPRSSHG